MRNLKRALSLAVAAAMLISLMVVGASAADYGDQAEVTQTEAVDVLTAIGVVGGDENGNFNPTDTLTRAEFCVMIANALTGGTFDQDLFDGTNTPFTDVQGHWGANYIAYCYSNGIVAGTSATTFEPDGTLTAAQAAAILLMALGYNQNNEFGANGQFSLNVTRWAQQAGLYAGVSVSANAGISRQDTAQVIFNALTNTTPVSYSSLAQSYYTVGTSAVSGVVLSGTQLNPKSNGGNEWENYQRTLGYINFDLVQTTATEDDAFNRLSSTWVYGTNRTVIGTYAEAPIETYNAKVTYADLYSVAGSTTLDRDVNSTIEVFIDGEDSVALTIPATLRNNSDGLASAAGEFTGNGTLTEIYVDDNDAIRIVVINSYLATVAADYDADDETVEIESNTAELADDTLSLEDFAGIVNYREGDKLVITVAGGVVQSVTPATVVEGAEVTAYGDNNVTANGTRYNNNRTATADDIADYDITNAELAYTLYLDTYGNVLGSEGVEATGNYVFISAWERTTGAVTGNGNYTAQAYFTDGTKAVIEVRDTDEINWNSADGSVNQWYTYTVNSSDVYTLTQSDIQNGDVSVGDGSPIDEDATKPVNSSNITLAGFRADSGTVFIFLDSDGDVSSTTTGIRNVDFNLTANVVSEGESQSVVPSAYVLADENGAIEAVVVVKYAGNATGDYIYIVGNNSSFTNYDRENEETYYTYNAIVNGESTTINALSGSLTKGSVYDATYAYGGLYLSDDSKLVNTNQDDLVFIGQVNNTAYRNGTLTLTPDDSYALADDYGLFTIDDTTVTERTATRLVSLTDDGADFDDAAAIVILNSDGEATCVLVIKNVTLSNAGTTAIGQAAEKVSGIMKGAESLTEAVTISGTNITASYSANNETTIGGVVSDLPQLLVALYNNGSDGVTTIIYDDNTYAWNASEDVDNKPASLWTLNGQIWSQDISLVTAISSDIKEDLGIPTNVNLTGDNLATIAQEYNLTGTLRFSFTITLDGVDFTYSGSIVIPAESEDDAGAGA